MAHYHLLTSICDMKSFCSASEALRLGSIIMKRYDEQLLKPLVRTAAMLAFTSICTVDTLFSKKKRLILH